MSCRAGRCFVLVTLALVAVLVGWPVASAQPVVPPKPRPAATPGGPLRPLVAPSSPLAPAVAFGNASPIALYSGAGTGYATGAPSQIAVSGIGTRLTGITVTLTDVTGVPGGRLSALLQAPDGTVVTVMSFCGNSTTPPSGVTVTLDDRAGVGFPSGTLASGTYEPCAANVVYAPPAPAPAANGFPVVRLTSLLGIDPNGTWSLWIRNNTVPAGSITGGWRLDLTADTPPPTTAFGPYANPSPITINDLAPASPYPSVVTVSGVPAGATVVSATVGLSGFQHGFSTDVGVLLQSPDGRAAGLSTACGPQGFQASVDLTLGRQGNLLPYVEVIPAGPSRPTLCTGLDALASPAAPRPYGNPLSDLQGATANGDWQLFVQDFASDDTGQIAGGWSLTLHVVVPPTPTPTATATTTATASATPTPTLTPTATPTATGTATATVTASATASGTAAPTRSATGSATVTGTPSALVTATSTVTATGATLSPTATRAASTTATPPPPPTPVIPEAPPLWLFGLGLLALGGVGWSGRRARADRRERPRFG